MTTTEPHPAGQHSHPPPEDVLELELQDESLAVDGSHQRGTAMAALRYPTFRRVYFGALLSNIGTWMQNAILGAVTFNATHSGLWVVAMTFAQLAPMLFLAMVGGAIADRFNRRTVLIIVSIEQLCFALVIAELLRADQPNLWAVFGAVFMIGIGQAVYAPAFGALVPTLVDRADMPGAISLNSASMNLSRVIGPAIGGVLISAVGVSWIMVGNAISYLFVIAALWTVHLPPPVPPSGQSRVQMMLEGVRVARADQVVKRCLVTMVCFSFFALPFVVLMPVIAARNLGVDPESTTYGFLYGTFGLGAFCGALAIGTVLAGRPVARLVRIGLAGFSVMLAILALLRGAQPAFPDVFVLGFFYFGSVTCLSTALQERLDDKVRARVMALWVMAFGGTVPIGALIAGPITDRIGVTPVLLFGAAVSFGLVFYARLTVPPGVPLAGAES